MAKIITYLKLRRFICHPGPYIYFYNDDSDGQNTQIKYINYVAKILQKLKVFQIDWKEIIFSNLLSLPDEKYKIYLYYNKEKKFESNILANENIDFIFIKGLEIFNNYMENRSKNTGSFLKRVPTDEKNSKVKFRKELSDKQLYYIKNQKKEASYKKD